MVATPTRDKLKKYSNVFFSSRELSCQLHRLVRASRPTGSALNPCPHLCLTPSFLACHGGRWRCSRGGAARARGAQAQRGRWQDGVLQQGAAGLLLQEPLSLSPDAPLDGVRQWCVVCVCACGVRHCMHALCACMSHPKPLTLSPPPCPWPPPSPSPQLQTQPAQPP